LTLDVNQTQIEEKRFLFVPGAGTETNSMEQDPPPKGSTS